MDAQLQHAIERDVRSGQVRAVLALHISRLQAPAPRPYHRRIAKAMLDNASQIHAGQVFVRANTDILLICDPTGTPHLRETLTRLFRVDAPPIDPLLSEWSLPQDAIALETYLGRTVATPVLQDDPSVAPGAIGAIEALLAAAPLPDLIRRQMAVQIVPGGMSPLYRELNLSTEALDARVDGVGSAQADPYLFRHLTGRLDVRMMEMLIHELSRPASVAASPALHLNLSVRAILSPCFLRLAEAVEQAGIDLGIEMTLIDICADPLAYAAARMVLRAHGAAVVLDGIGHQGFLLTRVESLEPDLVKLDWAPRMASLGAKERRLLSDTLTRINPKRVVLHQVDTSSALVWGMQQGISRFQGRHIDGLLAAGRLGDCPQATACTLLQCIERGAATGAAGRSGCRNTARLDSLAVTQAAFL